MFLGVAYYPEHWPQERWPIDARLMREANIGAARVGEFAWSRFEPREGEYDFGWLDEAIDVLSREGIRTIMCTPTATPPAWLIHAHPEIRPIEANGLVAKPFGSRRHYCCNVPVYREYTRRIVVALADHYGDHPDVIGWQIDNELGNVYRLRKEPVLLRALPPGVRRVAPAQSTAPSTRSTGPGGPSFGARSTATGSRSCCPAGAPRGEGLNPSHVLDFYRFSSDSWAEYDRLQADLLRERVGERWISTNFACGLAHETAGTPEGAMYQGGCVWFPCTVDWRQLSQSIDFPAWSSHVRGIAFSLSADYLRGIRADGRFAILEGGGARMAAYGLVARGGMGVSPFRWRMPLFGAESGVD